LASKGDGAAAIRLVKRNESRLAIARIDRAVDRIIQSERDRLHQISREVDRATQELLTFIYVISFAGLCLLILAGLIAIALYRSFERERHYREELKYRAETDELTGVANRRQLLASLDRAIAAARLNKTPLSFALVDIDNFKQVNDTHGHAAGDEVIRHVVQAGLATVRGYDTLGRLGGEEFGIILPKTSELNAYAVGERLRDQIHNLIVEIDDGVQISVTISTGIACLTAEDDAALLMERADRALYQAKRGGRDQVKLAA
jgi:diguanylate cyclase (GGDEF)-like protein